MATGGRAALEAKTAVGSKVLSSSWETPPGISDPASASLSVLSIGLLWVSCQKLRLKLKLRCRRLAVRFPGERPRGSVEESAVSRRKASSVGGHVPGSRPSIQMRPRRFSLSPAANRATEIYEAFNERPSFVLRHLNVSAAPSVSARRKHYHRRESGDINGWPLRERGRSGDRSVGEGSKPSRSQLLK